MKDVLRVAGREVALRRRVVGGKRGVGLSRGLLEGLKVMGEGRRAQRGGERVLMKVLGVVIRLLGRKGVGGREEKSFLFDQRRVQSQGQRTTFSALR